MYVCVFLLITHSGLSVFYSFRSTQLNLLHKKGAENEHKQTSKTAANGTHKAQEVKCPRGGSRVDLMRPIRSTFAITATVTAMLAVAG